MLHRKSVDVLLYTMILLFPFKRVFRFPFVGGFTLSIDDIIILGIIFIFLINIMTNDYKINIYDKRNKLFMIFFVLIFLNLLSILYSLNIRYALRAVYNTVENMLYYFATILLISKIKKNYLRIADMFILSSITLAISQIIYNLGFLNFNYKYNLPNGTIGISFCIGISFLIYFIINSNNKKRIIYIGLLIIISIGSYLLGSRSTWLSTSITFIISILLFIFNRTFLINGKKIKIIRIIPWLLIPISIFSIPFMIKIWDLLVSIRPITIFVRFDQWRTVVFNPSIFFGNGHGYFYDYYLEYGNSEYINIHGSEYLHNYFLSKYWFAPKKPK